MKRIEDRPLQYEDFKGLEIPQDQIEQILISPQDCRDLYTWDVNMTGATFGDQYNKAGYVTHFGEWLILKHIAVPKGIIYVLGDRRIDVVVKDRDENGF